MLYPSVRAPMRAPITPVLASKRWAAEPVGANFGGVGSSETSAILMIGLSMSTPPQVDRPIRYWQASRISIERNYTQRSTGKGAGGANSHDSNTSRLNRNRQASR